MPDDGSILAEEREEAEEAINSGLPEWVTSLAIPAVVVQAWEEKGHMPGLAFWHLGENSWAATATGWGVPLKD